MVIKIVNIKKLNLRNISRILIVIHSTKLSSIKYKFKHNFIILIIHYSEIRILKLFINNYNFYYNSKN